MSDVLTEQQRSYCMSKIKGRDTTPELTLRKALWKAGYRYRIKNKLPGKPDIVFPGVRLTVFIDGCFWHGCPEHSTIPKTNTEFWAVKLKRNKERDKEVNGLLMNDGWQVLRFWEHEIKKDLEFVIRRIGEKVCPR